MDSSDLVPVEDVTAERTPATTVEKPKWELKNLSPKHKRIVALKVAGLTREDISKQIGCTKEYISFLFKQPLVVEYLKELNAEVDQDLRDLTGSAVDTVRTLMSSGDDKVALAAATTALRANGKLQPQDNEDKTTAEDVVAKLFQMHNQGSVNVQINNFGKDSQ